VTLALLTSAAVLEATPGKGKGRGQTKVTICHYQGTHNGTPKYKTLKLGAPGAENHLTHHELDTPFVDCCPGDTCASKGECFTTVGCDATGTCAYTVNVSAPCAIGGVVGAGSCNVTGQCCTDPTDPTTCV
jgi:hypothetical protein